MIRVPVLLFVLLPASALAASFIDRVADARRILSTEEGRIYDVQVSAVLGRDYERIMRHCFETTASPETANFELVASVTMGRRFQDIAVEPATNIANCFANGVADLIAPIPPARSAASGHPIYIEMRLVP